MTEPRRGPKIGDSASLWNFTPSPGWTKEEAQVLKLCLQKFGIGRWVQILDTGLLPGKLIQQLNGQTQRLLGQQSLSAYTGLRVDIDRIRADNNARTDVERKSGLIIWAGKNPTRKMKDEWQAKAKAEYGLTKEQLSEVDEKIEELMSQTKTIGGSGHTRQDLAAPLISLMDSDPADLNRSQKLQLLRRLRQHLAFLYSRAKRAAASDPYAPAAAPSADAAGPSPGSPSQPVAAPAAQRGRGRGRTGRGGGVTSRAGAASAAKERGGRGRRAADSGTGDAGSGLRALRVTGRRTGKRRARQALLPIDPDGPWRKHRKTIDELEEEEEEEDGEDEMPAQGGAAGLNDFVVESSLSQLMAMGFDKLKCQDALLEAGGDIEAAAEFLFSACV